MMKQSQFPVGFLGCYADDEACRKVLDEATEGLNSLSGFSAVTPDWGIVGRSNGRLITVSIPCRVSRLLRRFGRGYRRGVGELASQFPVGFLGCYAALTGLGDWLKRNNTGLNSLSGFSAVTPTGG